jgi:streptogramin lyase
LTRTKIASIVAVSFLFILLIVSYGQINPPATDSGPIKNIETSEKSSYVKEFTLPDGSSPNGILVDGKGFVWVVGSNSQLYKINAADNKLDSVYVIGDRDESAPSLMMGWAIAEDNDGFLWLSQLGLKLLWRFDPTNEEFSSYSTSASPFQMKVDKENGEIWFTTVGNTLGVVQKTNDDKSNQYKIQEFDVGDNTFPSGLFLENEHVWVAQVVGNKVTKFKIDRGDNLVSSIEKVFEIPSDNETMIYSPTDVLVDDNIVWFTEHGTSTISKYVLGENQVKRFPTSKGQFNATTLPFWLKESPNGDGIWINEHTGNKIAFFNTTDTTLTEYEIPSRPADGSIVYPLGLSTTSNNVWFSEWNADKIAVIDAEKPIPFDIRVKENSIIIPRISEESEIIDVEIIGNDKVESHPISLMVSSSMEPSLGLINMTAKFTEEKISFTGVDTKMVRLMIDTHSAPSGNYTLAISATDGSITKSVFVDIVIN